MKSVLKCTSEIRNLLKIVQENNIEITEEWIAQLKNKMSKEAFLIFQELRRLTS